MQVVWSEVGCVVQRDVVGREATTLANAVSHQVEIHPRNIRGKKIRKEKHLFCIGNKLWTAIHYRAKITVKHHRGSGCEQRCPQ